MKTNIKAFELRSKLFAIVNEFKGLAGAANNAGDYDAGDQAERVGCQLAEIFENLPDLFIDAARDAKDQQHAGQI